MKRKAIILAAAFLPVAAPAAAQEPHEHPDCYGLPFWGFVVSHWHFPEILAELAQRNGPRSSAELDALALEVARSAADPDPDWLVEQIRTHFESDIRVGAEEAARGPCYDERDIDRLVARAIEGFRSDPVGRARAMAATTLQLAAQRGWRSSKHPPHAGIPYDGEGAFEAALLMYDLTGSDAGGLLRELDPERAATVFEGVALRPGPAACDALNSLRLWHWNEGDERFRPHSSYERLRRESPERCPELDDPGRG